MRIVDMFLHSIGEAREDLLFNLPSGSFENVVYNSQQSLKKYKIDSAMMVIFDNNILPAKSAFNKRENANLFLSLVPDLRRENPVDQVAWFHSYHAVSLTFHPYLQTIGPAQYTLVRDLAREAERLGMFICICTAFGSKQLYRYSSLELAVYLAESVRCPIILSHAGGAKVLEAMLIADAYPNIYLETSFSLPYWMGSSIEMDFAFAIKKLGIRRWMFGSDHPFVDMLEAVNCHLSFFKKYKFKDKDIESIMGANAACLLGV